MKICLLVPTYRRNVQLLRLLSQIRHLRSYHSGRALFKTVVTDSDPENQGSNLVRQLCDLYVIKKGIGFDDNLLHAYSDLAGRYDFFFSISDDDLFSSGRISPLDLLETAARQRQDAVLFNHCEYRSADMLAAELKYALAPPFYGNPSFTNDQALLRRHFLGYLPRHVGLLYRASHIVRNLCEISRFRNTLHLYAAPFMLALEKDTAAFFDYPLNYFSAEVHRDGAWEDWTKVFMGLYRFLVAAKGVLSSDSFEIAKAGFLANYLGDNSWLRRMLAGNVPSEARLLEQLNGI